MDRRGRLAERGEDRRVHAVDARQLQVVRLRVRRNALEQELREVPVLALVAVERDVEQAEPQRGGAEDDQAQQGPRPEARPPAHRDSRGRCQRCRVSIDVKPARPIPRPAGSPIERRASTLVARGAPWIVMVGPVYRRHSRGVSAYHGTWAVPRPRSAFLSLTLSSVAALECLARDLLKWA